ncbi:MAG: hypothetical protein RL112_2114, partial [Planctomycetota bacterium]
MARGASKEPVRRPRRPQATLLTSR